jgi:hypothetical protein
VYDYFQPALPTWREQNVPIETAPAPQPSIAVPIQPTTRLSFAPRAASASKAGTTSKSFWHTPWPYVIAGAVAATIIVVAHNTGSGTTSGGGY